MARYSYGSSGDGVKELQEMLNATGKYNLDTDGIYGNQTQQAVRDYQRNNNLTVDGVAGDQTLGHLRNNSTSAEAAPETPVVQPYQPTYTESQTVKDAQTQLGTHTAQQPGAYQSGYEEKLNALYDKIMNREPFNYDMNADPMYQQLKDQAVRQGNMAAEDAIGQAASLTGGFGNTYAQKVGQQTFNQHLQTLADKAPELYQLAMAKRQMEDAQLQEQYGMLMEKENQDYARHQDEKNQWLAERDYLAGRYDSERGYDYSKWQDQRDVGMQQQATKYDRLVSLITNMGYNPSAQELADAGMSAAEAAAYGKYYTEQNTPRYSDSYYSGNPIIEENPIEPIEEPQEPTLEELYGKMNAAEAFLLIRDIEKQEGSGAAKSVWNELKKYMDPNELKIAGSKLDYPVSISNAVRSIIPKK